jgi:hypothetical protein
MADAGSWWSIAAALDESRHPGTIVYVDGRTLKETDRVSATEVPPTLRYAPTPRGLVPVVKVVLSLESERRVIREYGPRGELLRSTSQYRDPN